AAKMGHGIGSCIRSPPAGSEQQDIELARISQRGCEHRTASPKVPCRFSRNGRYGIFGRDRAGHSALMPANFTTLAHFSVSLARRRPKLAGGPGSIVPPMLTSRAFALGSARIALISVLSRPMTSGGVFLGAMMPKNALAS